MSFDPCPGCSPTPTRLTAPTRLATPTTQTSPTFQKVYSEVAVPQADVDPPSERVLASDVSRYDATADDVVDGGADPGLTDEPDYTVTWDMPDTSKERLGLALAGGLAFLAPFVGFAVAAKVARGSKGYMKPVGAGAFTFFAMRAAAVGVLHFTGNMPAVVSTSTALGAVLPQVPRRTVSLPQRRVFGAAPCRNCGGR